VTSPVAKPAIGRTRPAQNGFTLLEVLAAVAILSIWFIVIAGTSVQGLRAEGESRRRLEAGQMADRILSATHRRRAPPLPPSPSISCSPPRWPNAAPTCVGSTCR
jgi:prepilin-type N-terminal cleavage/methylation domain-containing protein